MPVAYSLERTVKQRSGDLRVEPVAKLTWLCGESRTSSGHPAAAELWRQMPEQLNATSRQTLAKVQEYIDAGKCASVLLLARPDAACPEK